MLKIRPDTKPVKNQVFAFHTGLMAFDYDQFPRPPYRGRGWHVDFVLPPDELQMGGASIGDRIYPAKEAVIMAGNEVTAQRAADLIHAARLLLAGSNTFSHIILASMLPFERLDREKTKSTGTPWQIGAGL